MLAGSGSFLSVESRSILCKAIAIRFGQWPLVPMRRFLPAMGQIGQYAYGRSVAVNISTHCKATAIGLVQRCSALMARSLLVGVMIRQYAYCVNLQIICAKRIGFPRFKRALSIAS